MNSMLDLKAKNHEMAKALATAVSRNAELQRKLDEAQTHHSDLETELTAIYEKKYALDASLTEVLAGKPIERWWASSYHNSNRIDDKTVLGYFTTCTTRLNCTSRKHSNSRMKCRV